MITKRQSGICPRCGSNEVEYIDTDVSSWNVELQESKCVCDSCDLVFREYFKVVYDGFSFEDQNGKSHEFDENGKEFHIKGV